MKVYFHRTTTAHQNPELQYGVYNQEEKVQIQSGTAIGRTSRGALPQCRSLRQDPSNGRWILPGVQQQVITQSIGELNNICGCL